MLSIRTRVKWTFFFKRLNSYATVFLMVIMLQFLLMEPPELEKHTRNINAWSKYNRMLGTEDNPGNMFHTLKELFMKMKDYKMDREFKIRVSFLEIYNE